MAHFVRTHPNGVWEGVPAPTISPPMVPASVSQNGAHNALINGTDFQYATAVHFSGGAPDPSFVILSPTQIRITTSSLNPPGLKNVTVVTDTGSVTAVGIFTFT